MSNKEGAGCSSNQALEMHDESPLWSPADCHSHRLPHLVPILETIISANFKPASNFCEHHRRILNSLAIQLDCGNYSARNQLRILGSGSLTGSLEIPWRGCWRFVEHGFWRVQPGCPAKQARH
jgi:hypothetical protein